MSDTYEPYYSGGWQSGEAGGTPITPESLNYWDTHIKALYQEKAPAGYGLGDESLSAPPDNDANNAIYNGFYSVYALTANAPGIDGVMTVEVRSYGQAYQTIKQYGTGCAIQRCQNNGVWGEWEWKNPPMVAGIEYRTTRRRNSKPLYTKRINFGYLANSELITVSIGESIDRESITWKGTAANAAEINSFPIVFHDEGIVAYAYVGFADTTSYICVRTLRDMTTYSATFDVEYTRGD